MTLTEQIAQFLAIAPERVLACRADDEYAHAIINHGIGGGKKARIALSDLPASAAPPAPEPAPPEPLRFAPVDNVADLNATARARELIIEHEINPNVFKRDDRVTVTDVNYVLKRRREQ